MRGDLRQRDMDDKPRDDPRLSWRGDADIPMDTGHSGCESVWPATFEATAQTASWTRYFACLAVVILGIATFTLWMVSTQREQQQNRLARNALTLASAQSIAKEVSNAVDLGLPLDRLVEVGAYLQEKRIANRLVSLILLDAQHRVIAASIDAPVVDTPIEVRIKAPIKAPIDAPIEAPIRDSGGHVFGFIRAAPLADGGVGMSAIAVFTMFVAAASAAAFAGEGLAYAWRMGPLLRRRVLAHAVTHLQAEDYRHVFSGSPPRSWDRRAQHIVRRVRQINERYAQVYRLAQSLLQTQVAVSRSEAIVHLQREASEHARFASGTLAHRQVVAVQAQARWFCVTVGTSVGGLVQLMYLSAARHQILSVGLGGVDSSYLHADTVGWFDWRMLWHPVWQTAEAIDDPFRALCLYTCLFCGMALAGRQPASWGVALSGKRFAPSSRAGRSVPFDPALLPPVWPATICCLFVAMLSLSWRAALFDWRVACLYGALAGVASGVLLRACSAAIHLARRSSHFDNAHAPLDDAWLGMCLGLCWFGPLIVEVLFASIAPGCIAFLLCLFALSAGTMLFVRASPNSPWRQILKRRNGPDNEVSRRSRSHCVRSSCLLHHFPAHCLLTLRFVLHRLAFHHAVPHRLPAVAAGCVIAAIASSAHLRSMVLPVHPGDVAPMLLKWAALGVGLLCGATFSRYRGERWKFSAAAKQRSASGIAAVAAALLGMSSLVVGGALSTSIQWLSQGIGITVLLCAVLALSAGVWVMLAVSGDAPARHLATIAVTLWVLCITICCISYGVSLWAPACVRFLMQSEWTWCKPLLGLWTSLSQVSPSAYLWWIACAVLILATVRRSHDAT